MELPISAFSRLTVSVPPAAEEEVEGVEAAAADFFFDVFGVAASPFEGPALELPADLEAEDALEAPLPPPALEGVLRYGTGSEAAASSKAYGLDSFSTRKEAPAVADLEEEGVEEEGALADEENIDFCLLGSTLVDADLPLPVVL